MNKYQFILTMAELFIIIILVIFMYLTLFFKKDSFYLIKFKYLKKSSLIKNK